MVDLTGEFRHKVDAKGRLSLPARFRKDLSEDLVVTIDPDKECLYVFERPAFNEWVLSFFGTDENGKSSFNPQNRTHLAIRRELKSRAMDVEPDTSGRIGISAKQREIVEIGKEAVLVGNTGYFEIWGAERYDAREEVDLSALLSDM